MLTTMIYVVAAPSVGAPKHIVVPRKIGSRVQGRAGAYHQAVSCKPGYKGYPGLRGFLASGYALPYRSLADAWKPTGLSSRFQELAFRYAGPFFRPGSLVWSSRTRWWAGIWVCQPRLSLRSSWDCATAPWKQSWVTLAAGKGAASHPLPSRQLLRLDTPPSRGRECPGIAGEI